MSLTVSQAPDSTVNVKQFTALEAKFDTLVEQLNQLLSQPANKAKVGRGKAGQLPRVPSFHRPLTPESIPGTPEVGTPAAQPILDQVDNVAVAERASAKLAIRILDIIQRYGSNAVAGDASWSWPGKTKFLPLVEAAIVKHEPVKMVLPAFPFKSPNRRDKVLGSLPDLGEELALMHLNGLCISIAEIYEHGANVVIASDGLVYSGKLRAPFRGSLLRLTMIRFNGHRR